jgi:hypothetical protein
VNEKGRPVLLRGIGLGGWMLQEPYMFKFAEAARTQTEFKAKITKLIGRENCEEFYETFLANMITRKDVEALKSWGFNSIRLPMHYDLFTPPSGKEPVPGKNTWLEPGFKLTDKLLSWCKDNHMYLILDLHAAPGGQGHERPIADVDPLKPLLWESPADLEKTIALWKKLAERYAEEEWIGGYDLLNEPNYLMLGNLPLRNFFLEATREIRTVDKNHILFIEGNAYAQDFTGLTPPWDGNMAYSFHKYWSPNTLKSIQPYLDLRDKYAVPLWLGESGENTDVWFRDAVNLVEAHEIGWSWWTIKKLEGESSLMSVSTPAGYQALIDYWSGKGPKPSAESARATLMELAENVKFKHCRINYGAIEALLGKR